MTPPKRPVVVLFIHGLAKKPPVEKLKEIWLWALTRDNPMPTVFAPPNSGIDLSNKGVPQIFSYYADVFYGTDYDTDVKSYYEASSELEIAADGLHGIEPGLSMPHAVTPREQVFLSSLEAHLEASPGIIAAPMDGKPVIVTAGSESYEIASWLPDRVKQAIIKKFAMEAYYYLFDKEYIRGDKIRFMVRQELRARLLRDLALAAGQGERVLLVSHSMGTMVAYDVLRNCPDCPPVDTLITLGSPLGIQEIQDELVAADADSVDFPAAKLQRWVNVYDPLDPVCGADPVLSNDYQPVDGKRIEDVKESNWGTWRHTITHYLAGTELRKHIAAAIA